MKTHFYNRTPYRYIDLEPPVCFAELDDVFDRVYGTSNQVHIGRSLQLAENVCRRMADVDLYASLIHSVLQDDDFMKASIMSASYIVSYLSSCKSLLDAAAITLSEISHINLGDKQKDFSKGRFWNQLNLTVPDLHARFLRYKPLVGEIVTWRDAAIHRITPLVLVQYLVEPSEASRDNIRIRMLSSPGVSLPSVMGSPKEYEWADPLFLHAKWRDSFVDLCNDICSVIADAESA